MSIDTLQENIRKMKNPSVVDFSLDPETIPVSYLGEGLLPGYEVYAGEILSALKDLVPAVRFSMGSFALRGAAGLEVLSRIMQKAGELGYYVILDLPEMGSGRAAECAVATLLEDSGWCYHGVIISSYLGSDVYRPFQRLCRNGKAVFAVVRTSNRTAAEVQDLLTGSRTVHAAVADIVNRQGETGVGKFGYCDFSAVAAASSAESLRNLRSKYKNMFLLMDGYDYPNANAKNCSYGFDRFGHGAAACAGSSILGAWKESGGEPVASAVQAAERMKKNLTRYITIL